jgi:hypothetical protein
MSDLDKKNAKVYEDFQKRLSATGKVLDELEIENKQKAAEAMEQVAALQRKTSRVPDGRRIYPSADGNWRFEDQSRVPPDLVTQRVEPPREGWPSLDMRIPPTFDQRGCWPFI